MSYELSVCTKVAFESDVGLSVCFKSTPASNCELSTQSAFAKVPNAERFVCLTTLNEINTELSALSVTAQRPAFAPLTPPVLSQETISASHVFHVNSVTVIETINELSASVSVYAPDFELSVSPVPASAVDVGLSVSEPDYELSARETIEKLFVFSASSLGASVCLVCLSVP